MLRAFVPSAQEEHDDASKPGEINPVSRTPIDPKLHHSGAYGLDIAEIACRDTREPRLNPAARLSVRESLQPIGKRLPAIGRLVNPEIDRGQCNL